MFKEEFFIIREKGVSMVNKKFLVATAFLCGVAVMGVELTANRLLAPYFGSSQIVWTVIIGLIMIFMSLGNYFGGKYADKMENMGKLYRNLFFTAIWILILPLVGKYIILGITFLLVQMGVSQIILVGSIVTCILLFSFPLMVLGTVSPTLVRFGIDQKENAGEIAGKIYAGSNIGSIFGSFLPTFFTLPVLGTQKSFVFFAMILIFVSIAYALRMKHSRKFIVQGGLFILLLAVLFVPINESYAFWDGEVIYEGESIYNYLQVKETESATIFSTNVAFGVQSEIQKNAVLTGAYFDYFLFAPLYQDKKEQQKILILGYGTGTMDRLFSYYYPQSKMTGVEIDQEIIELGKTFFQVDGEKTELHIVDGRTFLSGTDEKYDLIIVDAYQDVNIPFHMATKEFFDLTKEKLAVGGVLAINVNMHDEREHQLLEALLYTVSQSYKEVFSVPVKGSTNLSIVATNGMITKEKLKARFEENLGQKELKKLYNEYFSGLKSYEKKEQGEIFTDDRAPLEKYSQKILQKLVEKELEQIKEMTKGKSISELLESF